MKYDLYHFDHLIKSFDRYDEALIWLEKNTIYTWTDAIKYENWHIFLDRGHGDE